MPLSFSRAADLWLADIRRSHRPKTAKLYEHTVHLLLRRHPELRERPITRADLLEFRNARADERSPLSANRDLKALRACLRWAWINDLDHPDVKLRRLLLPAPKRREQALTADEIQRVLAAAAFDLEVLVVVRICHATASGSARRSASRGLTSTWSAAR